jgi:hypothetical protein
MIRFEAELVPGGKAPYDKWTFVILPAEVHESLGGSPRAAIRGTLEGAPFRATVSRGEGVMRFAVTGEVRQAAGVGVGDRIEVAIELDPEARLVELPAELEEALDHDPTLASQFEAMAPSHRRAWAEYIAEAKRPETRKRRAERARQGIAERLFPSQTKRTDEAANE